MGRYKPVDRDHVLAAAEAIVCKQGVDALTIDAVARAAGISKGGVQSSFGSKGSLVMAMFERCVSSFEASVAKLAAGATTPTELLRAYVEATRRVGQADGDRAASLMAALLNFPDVKASCQDWYKQQLKKFDATTPEGRRARVVFLANEGVFMLRFFGLMQVSKREWNRVFDDLQALLD